MAPILWACPASDFITLVLGTYYVRYCYKSDVMCKILFLCRDSGCYTWSPGGAPLSRSAPNADTNCHFSFEEEDMNPSVRHRVTFTAGSPPLVSLLFVQLIRKLWNLLHYASFLEFHLGAWQLPECIVIFQGRLCFFCNAYNEINHVIIQAGPLARVSLSVSVYIYSWQSASCDKSIKNWIPELVSIVGLAQLLWAVVFG